jgi:hypothetical protein
MATDPPYSGTIYLDGKIITTADPTAFLSVTDAGQAERSMFDRRLNDWKTFNAYLFNAKFDDGLAAEIRVNPEFGSSDAARIEAQKYGAVIGKLPKAVRTLVKTVSIHQGVQLFGGGENLVIHTGQADQYERDGILEETLVHEACHTLDAAHSSATWIAARTADKGTFISTYARDNPQREDVAESFLCWLAVRYRRDRISKADADKILEAIPNRIAYFDAQAFDMHPIAQLTGTWTYRSFNPTYVMGGQTPQEELDLILAGRMDDVYLNLHSHISPVLEGTIEWPGGGLDLKGTVDWEAYGGVSYDFVGTGRPGTATAGWEYGYHGHQTPHWIPPPVANRVDPNLHSFLVGSVIRVQPHNGQPGGGWVSPAGEVFSFIARFQPRGDTYTRATGSFTYRSFHNRPTYVYPTAPQTAHLILQEAVFKLETGTSTTEPTTSLGAPIVYPRGPRTFMPLQGTIEWPGGRLDIDSSRSAFYPDEGHFVIAATGRPGTATAGWEYRYGGHLTRHWQTALVGSAMRAKSHGDAAPAGYVAPFIAVKQPPSR